MSPSDSGKQKGQKQTDEKFESPGGSAVRPPQDEDTSEDVRMEGFDAPTDTPTATENAAANEAQTFRQGTPRSLLDAKAQIQAMLLKSAENGVRR